MVLPNFLICGAEKSGTTTLQENLSLHPEIYISEKKGMMGREIHFFNNDDNFEKGLEWYEKHFEMWNGEKAIGEKTIAYLSSPKAPERIHSVIPDVKLIFILRNPVDRAYSAYWMKKRNGVEEREFIEACFASDTDYLEVSKYSIHLKRYKKYFSNEQMLVLNLDKLHDNPDAVYRQICEFICVNPELMPKNYKKEHYRGGQHRSKLLSKVHKKVRYVYNMPTIAEMINLINIKGQMVEYFFGKEKKSYPPMDKNTRSKLIEYFKPYNIELKEMYPNLNIESWMKE